MRVLSSRTCSIFGLCGGIVIALALPVSAHAGTVTACTAIDLCYCVNTDVRSQIDANVARVRQLIAEQRKQDKAIGYLSIPLSTAGGSYFGVNTDVAQQAKDRIEKRYGANSLWMLNPGAEGNLPPGATGADYMLMWTTILEGAKGLGEDFDFFYFTGPSSFHAFFGLDGTDDMGTIDAYFDKRLATDRFAKGRRQRPGQSIELPQLLCPTSFDRVQLRLPRRMEYRAHHQRTAPRLDGLRRRQSAWHHVRRRRRGTGRGRGADCERRRGTMHQLTVTATPR